MALETGGGAAAAAGLPLTLAWTVRWIWSGVAGGSDDGVPDADVARGAFAVTWPLPPGHCRTSCTSRNRLALKSELMNRGREAWFGCRKSCRSRKTPDSVTAFFSPCGVAAVFCIGHLFDDRSYQLVDKWRYGWVIALCQLGHCGQKGGHGALFGQ